ncbi:MmgE/PrpD family protein [Brucella intermedia]|uniref:MmgE/PrpD family protein n=1 Tax=Brucella intermedia TaxID=94625 RepID=A0A7V6PFZ1_9HYPH|nr:MmgE/PrpD family protein [Brucella intermedia]PJR89114.1 2-methylcitrate dehydratase [Ochrobactrum sp. 721/2009]PJT13758.1 2-methylcitrate dehydratase [Ochrobactrum sp. 720/2009]PJT18533.1 2-methylcitrate dehydratase [Ochrobactrum sp. 715/2009]PJT23872.1 2-methylcitrate dehydratase [Ochrobactrum sp. 695/2009]PJT33810.1 2-methylcitrate dehydratase [Ochrobactrum sp. 689/2009]
MQREEMTVALAIASACAKPIISTDARKLACDAILDTLACMVAGRGDDSTKSVAKAFAEFSAGGTALSVTGGTGSPMFAALVNGTAAHALDFDDNFLPGMSHASAVIVPAIVALADLDETTGRRLIDAYLAGLQAQALVGEGLGQAHYTAGWHGTSTVGSIGTAVATAQMLGLDITATAQAITIAASFSSGTKGQFGTLIKPFHAGMAARNAVEAALLAKAGMQARHDILEGEQGIRELFAGDPRLGWNIEAILSDKPHVIETVGVMPKRHPCCGSTHMIVDALLDLHEEHGFDAEDILAVNTLVGIANYRNLAYTQPVDQMQARFSMQYCVARALRQRYLTLADFTPEAVDTFRHDPLINAITMRCYSAEEERASAEKLPHVVTVTLKNGCVLQAARSFAVGTLQQPFSADDRTRKFLDCCAALPAADKTYWDLRDLDDAENLKAVATLFTRP